MMVRCAGSSNRQAPFEHSVAPYLNVPYPSAPQKQYRFMAGT
jgi:hypothetical protein